MLQTLDFATFLIIALIIALTVAVINFIIGLIYMLRMASLKGLSKSKKLYVNSIWSLIVFIASFFWPIYIPAFLINLIIGLIALRYEEYYGLKHFRRRLKILLTVLTVQFILIIIVYITLFFLLMVYFLGI